MNWRRDLIRRVLRGMFILITVMVMGASYAAYSERSFLQLGAFIGVYVVWVALILWRRAPYLLQVTGIQLMLYVVSFVVFLGHGLGDSSRIFLLAMVFVSALFLGWRWALFTLALVLVTMMGMGWAFIGGYITNYIEVVSTDLESWILLTLEVVGTGLFIALLLNYYTVRFDTYMNRSHALARALAENQAGLEEQIAERTAALEKRTVQLEAAAEVAREAAEIHEVETLLEQTVELISDRFGFYHTAIFLLDEAGEYAVLRAASSEEGQHLLASGHRLQVGEVGVVGYVTKRGEPRIAQDVSADKLYFNNPEMTATRSELTVPLRVRGKVIGALDVQSVDLEAFSSEDVNVLQTLAGQVAVAIENARLIAESQAALEATQRAYGEMSRAAWQEMLRVRQGGLRARHDPQGILHAAAPRSEETHTVGQEAGTLSAVEERPTTHSVPLKVRGQVIGWLDAYVPGEKSWSAEQLELLETLADQLSVALESARLFEDAQRRAAREQLVSEVTGRLRASLDVDAVLQTTIRELGRVLGAEGTVRMAPLENVEGTPERGEV
ncbi:MAG: GAF domain-containing protein [Anaerolineales bacterium]